MTNKKSNDEFIFHVGKCVEMQLNEWDDKYEVMIIKFKEYIFIVKFDDRYYEILLTEPEMENLKKQAPFALDKFIWTELEVLGIKALRGYGDYIGQVFLK